MPFHLGSSLHRKVCNIESLYFNWTMFNYFEKVFEMEEAHGLFRNPKLLENDQRYAKLGPIEVCIEMREEYGKIVQIMVWSALVY